MPGQEVITEGVTLKDLQDGAEIPRDTTKLDPKKPIGGHMTEEIEERVAFGQGT